MANESQAYSAKQFQKFGPEMGFDVTILDGRADAQVQAQAVNNCVAQKFDAIFVNPNDINGIVPSLTAAKKAGVIVGLFSSDLPPNFASSRDIFVGVNDNEAGETAAKSFLKQFPNGANIVEIGGQSGHDAAIKRHDGFNAAIKGSKINVLDYKACNAWSTSEAMTIMEDMITKYGNKIQGVFCHWDNGATGVIEAAKAAKLSNLFIVAVDGCRAGFDQVKAGTQNSTIMQNFAEHVKVSLEMTMKALKKEPFTAVNFIPLNDVNKSNINNFEYPEW
jgi:ABC-type sugar transport system substrate-binding protein